MVSCTHYEKGQDAGDFYADTVADLADLPNLTNNGKAELAYMNKVNAGSTCILPNGDVYVLTGDNTWTQMG